MIIGYFIQLAISVSSLRENSKPNRMYANQELDFGLKPLIIWSFFIR